MKIPTKLAAAALVLLAVGVPRHLTGGRWAWVIAAIFCAMPVGNLSYLQYIA